MNTQHILSITAFVFSLGLITAAPANAQPASPAAPSAVASQHHRMMADMMKDMAQEMTKMSEQMMKGELPPDQRKMHTQRMERMSQMMHRMLGLYARPAMKEPDMQKEMQQMRKQMDDMTRDPTMKPPAK